MHGDEISEKIIGAAIEVHRILGPGLLESVYEEALRTSASSAPLRSLEGIEYGSGVDMRRSIGMTLRNQSPLGVNGRPLRSSFLCVAVLSSSLFVFRVHPHARHVDDVP
jgi:DNA mismatch repair protein MutH